MTSVWRNLLANLSSMVAVVTLPLGILASILLGTQAAAVVFVVGWLLLTPLSAILVDDVFDLGGEKQEEGAPGTREDPLETLRDRYARGEIDEVTFENRLEVLMETESLSGTERADVERALDAVREAEPEPELDRERG